MFYLEVAACTEADRRIEFDVFIETSKDCSSNKKEDVGVTRRQMYKSMRATGCSIASSTQKLLVNRKALLELFSMKRCWRRSCMLWLHTCSN